MLYSADPLGLLSGYALPADNVTDPATWLRTSDMTKGVVGEPFYALLEQSKDPSPDLQKIASELNKIDTSAFDPVGSPSAMPSLIQVTTTDDVVDASGLALGSIALLAANPGVDGEVSLREAIIAANADAMVDEIELGAGTFKLTLSGAGVAGDLDISTDLVLRGQGQGVTVIDADGLDRVFKLIAGNTVFENITVTGGETGGTEDGGGILVDGATLSMDNVTVTGNLTALGEGGGIWVGAAGTLIMQDSIISNNESGSSDSPTRAEGGGLYSLGDVTLQRVTVDTNLGNSGAGLYNVGQMRVSDSWIVNNQSSKDGGGIHSHGGSLEITRVTFEANRAEKGAGLDTDTSTVTVEQSTFSGNVANNQGGAIRSHGSATDTVLVTASTFASNGAKLGGVAQGGAELSFENSLFAGNSATNGSSMTFAGNPASAGFNIFDEAGFTPGAETDLVVTDARIGPLQDNGGAVKTHALLASSPAINAGSASVALDATGIARNSLPDVGAYEFRQATALGKLYWSDITENAIYRANANGTGVQKILTTTETPFDIEIDALNQRLYWIESDGDYGPMGNLGAIKSAGLDGRNITTVADGLLYPTGLALDEASGYLYVTIDATTVNSVAGPYINQIQRMDLDGSNPLVLLEGESGDPSPKRMISPTDIEYDALSNSLFWSDRGHDPIAFPGPSSREIKMLDLSDPAAQPQVLYSASDSSRLPHGITLTQGATDLYWASTEGIGRIELGGAGVQSHSASLSADRILGIQQDLESGVFYLTDHYGSIRTISADLATTAPLIAGLTAPTGIAVYNVPVNVAQPNAAPVAVNDVFTLAAGSASQLNLAANDSDSDDGLNLASIAVTTAPDSGVVSANPDGTVVYTHDGSSSMADSFVYSILDTQGAVSNTATVLLTIVQPDSPPLAVADTFTVAEGSSTSLGLLANDSGTDNGLDLASIEIVSDPSSGTLVVTADGNVSYTHDSSETSSDSFTYRVRDMAGLVSDIVSVTLVVSPVNDVPVARADSYTVLEGSTNTLPVISNDSDLDDGLDLDSLSVVSGPLNGSLVNNADGTVSYIHDASETLADTFSYRIADLTGALTDEALVTLDVIPVNDAPSLVATEFSVPSGESVPITAAILSTTDADTSEPNISYQLSAVNGGQFELINSPGAALSGFTQQQVDAGEIVFASGGIADAAGFTVVVSDGQSSLAPQQVGITVIADQEPEPGPAIAEPIDPEPVPVLEASVDLDPAMATAQNVELPLPVGNVLATVAKPVTAKPAEAVPARLLVPEASTLMVAAVSGSITEFVPVQLDFVQQQPDAAKDRQSTDEAPQLAAAAAGDLPVIEALPAVVLTRIDLDEVFAGMNELRNNMVDPGVFGKNMVGSGIVLTSALSVGYVIWLIRGGVLLSTVLSSLPAWYFVDPLPVLANRSGDDEDEDDSLVSIIEHNSAPAANGDEAGRADRTHQSDLDNPGKQP